MQRVAELVEHRHGVVPRDEDGLAGLGLHEVGVVRHDRVDRTVEPLLRPVGVHPRARVLARARVGVEVPEADVLAALVLHLVDGDVLLVDGDRGRGRHLGEREAVELPRRPEHPLPELVELEVELHLVHVEVVLRLADLLGVVAVVPRSDLELRVLLVRDGLHVVDLLVYARDGGGPDLHHQAHRLLGRLGHRVVEAPVGVRREAEELGALCPQAEDLGDALAVVVRVLVVAAAVVRPPDLLAQVAPVRVGQEGVHRGARVGDGPLSLVPQPLGRGGARPAYRLGQAREVALALQVEDVALLVGEQVQAELRVERREPLVDRRHARLRGGIELRAGVNEILPHDPRESLLLRGQLGLVRRAVDRLDPTEEPLVLRDLVLVRGELGLHLDLDGLKVGRLHGRAPHAVHGRDAIERPAGALHRRDRVVEGRGRGVRGDAVERGERVCHPRLEGGLEVLDVDLVERRHATKGSCPVGEKWVGDDGGHGLAPFFGVLDLGRDGCRRLRRLGARAGSEG